MTTMVDKFADKDPVEEEETEESEFEEIQKPPQRQATKPVPADVQKEDVSAGTPALPKPTEDLSAQTEVDPGLTTKSTAAEMDDEVDPGVTSKATTARLDDETQTQTTDTEKDASIASLEREMRNMKTVIAQQTRQLASLQKTVETLVSVLKK